MIPFLIIGGGVAGLQACLALARQGYFPMLLEAGQVGRGTSWAAAGMLAPVHEIDPTELPLLRAGQASLKQYLALEMELAGMGLDIGLRKEGTLEVVVSREDLPLLQRQYAFMQQQGLRVEWLDNKPLHELEPALAYSVPAGVFAPDDWQLDNRKLVDALAMACRLRRAVIHEQAEVAQLVTHDEYTEVMLTDGRTFRADQVLLATGAAPVPWETPTKVYPVRGQMLSVAPPPEGLLQRVVRIRTKPYGNGYVVPKDDRIVIGSNSEEMGYDTRLTAGGLMDILRRAYLAVPGLYDLPVLETWAGLRPATLHRRPVLEKISGTRVWVLNGLYRHGILLSPLMGEAAARALLGQPLPPDAAALLHLPAPSN